MSGQLGTNAHDTVMHGHGKGRVNDKIVRSVREEAMVPGDDPKFSDDGEEEVKGKDAGDSNPSKSADAKVEEVKAAGKDAPDDKPIDDSTSKDRTGAGRETPLDTAIVTNKDKEQEKVVSLKSVVPEDYNSQMLPKPAKGPVRIKLRILLEHIYGVKQSDRTITVGIRTFCLWKDPKLVYDVDILGRGMSYFQVNPDNIWTPRIEILNVVGSEVTHQLAQVFPDGSVFLTTRMMSVVTVRFAAQWFPFDRQKFIFEYGELGYSKDLVTLDTNTLEWEPAFSLKKGKRSQLVENMEHQLETAQDVQNSAAEKDVSRTIESAKTEEKYKEPVEVLQQGNFIIGMSVIEDKHGDSYWLVDNFTGWQDLRYGEGARYYYVGVSTLIEMHRGRAHFILVYILPLVFMVTVSQVNWFFDVRDLDPRMTVASGLLLCMVAFQYTIEQEIPKVSYPLWINYYLIGCYCMLVLQCFLMVVTLRLAGKRVATNQCYSDKTVRRERDVGGTAEDMADKDPRVVKQWEREQRAETFNMVMSFAYPTIFLLFNIMMFGMAMCYT